MSLKRSEMMVSLACLLAAVTAMTMAEPGQGHTHALTLQHIANVSYADEKPNLSTLASMFSPRMDFDQWKPLTGRGDPLRNDPTYDYEPPVLERVHYWADDARLEREQYPERKSEVLMLGVSSRKPSVIPRHPPPRRHRPHYPNKYEDYSYKLSEHYPMTILVPPPRPPPGHKPPLYILEETMHSTITDPPKLRDTPATVSVAPEHSSYALQEANLIFQASTTNHDWVFDYNQTQQLPNNVVSSDYAGWGPTTPLDEALEQANDTHNLISNDHFEYSNHPYSFYKPMLSHEAPPPPKVTQNPLLLPTFLPTSLPPFSASASGFTSAKPYVTQPTWSTEVTDTETPTEIQDYELTTTTEKYTSTVYYPTPIVTKSTRTTKRPQPQLETSLFDMLHPMMSMPLTDGPERPEDNLYAHASENLHVFKENEETTTQLETMQTMQPPPPVVKPTESATNVQRQPLHMHSHTHNMLRKKPSLFTHDPYLHMRFTTPMPTEPTSENIQDNTGSTTEVPSVPILVIQGHSKVKTYGFKPKPINENDTIHNEITRPNETNQVRHLHTLKDKYSKPEKSGSIRASRAQNLKALVEEGHGSIEIQEANLGIKYDVSDGSEVPVEIYRKGIVESDENDYSKAKKRTKRQFDLEDLAEMLPDEKFLDGYVYSYLKDKQNATGLTGMLAKVVAGGAGSVIDEIDEDSDEDEEDEDEDR